MATVLCSLCFMSCTSVGVTMTGWGGEGGVVATLLCLPCVSAADYTGDAPEAALASASTALSGESVHACSDRRYCSDKSFGFLRGFLLVVLLFGAQTTMKMNTMGRLSLLLMSSLSVRLILPSFLKSPGCSCSCSERLTSFKRLYSCSSDIAGLHNVEEENIPEVAQPLYEQPFADGERQR